MFYRCSHCGNLVGMINNSGVPLVCCGQEMTALVANTTDAAQEKHVPVTAREGKCLTVRVGSVDHPMTAEHSIEWVYVKTESGGQRKTIAPGCEPLATFYVEEDEVQEVYAYCNLHGLWKA